MAIASITIGLIGLMVLFFTYVKFAPPRHPFFYNDFFAYLRHFIGLDVDILIAITAKNLIIVIVILSGLILGILSLRRETRSRIAITGIVLNSIVIFLPIIFYVLMWLWSVIWTTG